MADAEVVFPHLEGLPPTLKDSTVGTPDRRPGSVRRTSTLDMVWPDGLGTDLNLVGRSRDLMTPRAGDAEVLAEATMRVVVGEGRKVLEAEVTPTREGIGGLVGAVGGSELRGAIERVLPGEREAATPLYLLLDDIAGTSLIAGFAWSRARPELRERMRERRSEAPVGESFGVRKGKVICSGLRPDGWADTHWKNGLFPEHGMVPAGDIRTPEDSLGWHEFPPAPEVGMRRHRRVDAWREGDEVHVDAFFRDACWEPDGSQIVLHEYRVEAQIDAETGTLRAAEATPHVLPYPECKWAAPNASALAGMRVSEFRNTVQRTLVELKACTHLNDMLRCLAEVPALVGELEERAA